MSSHHRIIYSLPRTVGTLISDELVEYYSSSSYTGIEEEAPAY